MKAVIIAGGWGTRLRPLTYNIHKSIVPVVNRPFVIHQIELLKQYGVTEIILNLHYLAKEVKTILGDGKALGVKMYYSIEEKPLGTCGAVKNAEEFFKGDKDPMLVFNGDVLTDINLDEVIKFHRQKNARVTLTLTRVEDPTSYGLIITDKSDRVIKFQEKPSWEQVTANTINAGIYVMDPQIFQNVPTGVEYSFERDLYHSLLQKEEPIYGFVTSAYWLDIGSPQKYKQAHRDILHQEVKVKVPGKRERGNVWIGDDVGLDASAHLHGPSLIGSGSKVGKYVQLNELTVLGDNVTVGEGSTIEESIIWTGTKIGREVIIKGSIVGANCKIEDGAIVGPGIVLANRSVIRRGSKLRSEL